MMSLIFKGLLSIIFINTAFINTVYAQINENEYAAENFLAEVYLGNMKEGSEYYIQKNTSLPEIISGRYIRDDFRKINIDSTIADELYKYYRERWDFRQTWNENAPVFQLPKYKNLVFLLTDKGLGYKYYFKTDTVKYYTSIDEYGLGFSTNYYVEIDGVEHYVHSIGKPAFNSDYTYAVVEVNFGAFGSTSSSILVIFKKSDGKWIEIGSFRWKIS
jgi:hypothetical protein